MKDPPEAIESLSICMCLLCGIGSVIGWKWPYRCLTLVKTVKESEYLLKKLLTVHELPILPIANKI